VCRVALTGSMDCWLFELKFRADVTGRKLLTVDVAPVGLNELS